jgi:cyclic beta-1,2-glucan synthetase
MHLLGTGRLRTFVTRAGGTFSAFDGRVLTRHAPGDDAPGPVVYVRDLATRRYWTAGLVPGAPVPDAFEGRFEPGCAAFHRRDGDMETTLEIAVSPENDVEVRRVGLTNHGAVPVQLEVTTYLEAVLDPAAGDRRLPAFSGVFVQTDFVPGLQALVAEWRRRSPDEAALAVAHTLVPDDDAPGEVAFEKLFLGRTRQVGRPLALTTETPLSGTTGAMLDPVLALRRTIILDPGQRRTLTATLGIGPTREAALTSVFAGLAGARSARVFEQAAKAAGPGDSETFAPPSVPLAAAARPSAVSPRVEGPRRH